MSYLGTPPNEDIVSNVKEYIATAGQTVFEVIYDNYAEVSLNGTQLASSDYTMNSGISITLTTGATAGDIVQCTGYESFKFNNTVNTINAQTIDGVKTFNNNPVIPNAVNNNEPLSMGQLVNATPLAGSNTELINSKKSSVTSVADTIPVRDANTAITGKNQCTAWVNFDGQAAPVIYGFYNIASITYVSTGYYDVLFIIPMANINYTVNVSAARYDGYTSLISASSKGRHAGTYKTVNGFRLHFQDYDGTEKNCGDASITIYGGK